ncbi:MAG: protease modulator HflC [Gammaproteobacteria bacterium]|nr:protease modulator HflC [Gammaproteobacteria bacterium]
MKFIIAIFIFVIVSIGSASFFTVNETEKALMFQWGKIVRSDFEPGFHMKIPFMNNVRKFDARIQSFDARPQRYLTLEKKNVIVDSFIQWKIDNVKEYYTSMRGNVGNAQDRISTIISEGLLAEFGKRNMHEVISGERKEIMDKINISANKIISEFGISIVDVRIKRIELPPEVSLSVYQRMESERQRIAKDYRSRGQEEATKIRAQAEKERTIILAEAYKTAEIIRGEGDAKAAQLYAQAFDADKEFFTFYRSLNAYKNSFSNQSDVMVLSPDSDFFSYFKQANGSIPAKGLPQ